MDHRRMILDPDKWPSWPFLPLKRRNNKLEEKNLGVLYADGTFTIVHVFLFDLTDFDNAPRTEYKSVDDLLADGWIVD